MRPSGIAAEVARSIGVSVGLRVLHVSDIHNRVFGLRLIRALDLELVPAVTINTGDFSGVGGIVEAGLVWALGGLSNPLVFAPGNHDGAVTAAAMARTGALILAEPRTVEVSGLRVWGYADPNRTRFGRRDPYRNDLCEAAAEALKIPSDRGPIIVAVHNERMLPASTQVPLVFCGHLHTPSVQRAGSAVVVRCGSTGGGGPFGGAVHFAIVDIDPKLHSPLSIWMGKVDKSGLEVTEVPCGR